MSPHMMLWTAPPPGIPIDQIETEPMTSSPSVW